MSVALRVVSIALIAGLAMATCASVTNNVYRMSACAGYTACSTTLCTCAGTTGTSETCLSGTTANCTAFTTCTMNFFKCLDRLASATRSNTSDPCNTWAVALHAQLLNTAVASYAGSALQTACGARACDLKNRTSLSTCSFGTNYSSVCMAPPTTTVAATTTTTTTVAYAVRAIIRLSGNWTAALANATAVAQLQAALQTDLAGLLQIAASFVTIIDMRSGSLVVDFGVAPGSNATAADLQSRVNTATSNTNWLTSTQAVATANGLGTISVTSVAITTTTAAGTTSSSSTTTSSAASVSAVAVAVAAVMALLF